jgi:hypothetical protein
MDPTKSSKNTIYEFIQSRQRTTAKELEQNLGVSRTLIFRHLKSLLQESKIEKIGEPPFVYYAPTVHVVVSNDFSLSKTEEEFIDTNYLYVTPTGSLLYGLVGFVEWCNKTKQNIEKSAKEYIKILKKYNSVKKDGIIENKLKLENSFNEVFLNKMYYINFYSIEKFGKTKLGQLLLYAKQNQDKSLIKKVSRLAKPHIEQIVNKFKIDHVLFVPPTVKRQVQFMKEFENYLELSIAKVNVKKLRGTVVRPQKTIEKLQDRIENARNSFYIEPTTSCKNILVIDDAVGSGATLNEIARQIKSRKICTGKVIGFGVTGSAKGFDIISEV